MLIIRLMCLIILGSATMVQGTEPIKIKKASETKPEVEGSAELASQPKRTQQYGFIYGFASGISQKLYQGADNRVYAFPVIGYRGEKLDVLGPFVSYRLKKTPHLEIAMQLKPRFDGYEASDSEIFQDMEDRDLSVDAGILVSYKYKEWKTKVSAIGDILGRSHGKSLAASLGKTYKNGPFFLEPRLGIEYIGKQYVDYYYGVRITEATSEREAYIGTSDLTYSLGLSFMTPIVFEGFTRISLDYVKFGSSISKSPLTDTNKTLKFMLVFSKYF